MLKTNRKMRVQGIDQNTQVKTGRQGLMRKLESIMHAFTFGGGSRQNMPFSLDGLENRQMLAAVTMTPGEYLNFDLGAGNGSHDNSDGIVLFGSGSTGITSIGIQDLTDGGANDSATLNITVNDSTGADAVEIRLASNIAIGSIDLSGLNAGTTSVSLVVGTGITITASAADTHSVNVDGIAVATTMQNAMSTTMASAMGDQYDAVANSGIGNTTFGATNYTVASMPVQLHMIANGTGSIGSINLGDTDLSLVGPTTVTAGSIGLFTVAGAVAPGGSSVNITANDNAGSGITGLSFGNVSIAGAGNLTINADGIGASGITITNGISLTGAGNLTINSDTTGGNNNTVTGPVTIGGITNNGTGDILIRGGGAANGFTSTVNLGNISQNNTGDITVNTQNNGAMNGAVTIGTVNTNSAGAALFTVAPNGTGSIASIAVGNITLAGTGASIITIGGTTNSVGGNFDASAITNSSTNNNGDINLLANNIGGFFDTEAISLTGAAVANLGDLVINIAGNLSGALTIAEGLAIVLGDQNEAGDGGALTLGVTGTSASALFGTITNRNTTSADFNATFTGNIAGSLSVGTIDISNTTGANDGDIAFSATGIGAGVNIASGSTLTIGDSTGQADTGVFSLLATGVVNGATVIGDTVLQSTSNVNGVTVNYTNATSSGALTIGTITSSGTGNQANDFSFATAGALTAVTVGVINVGSGDTNSNSGVTINAADTPGAVISFGNITNGGNANVQVNLSSDATADSTAASLTLGAVALSNATNVNNGNVIVTVDAVSGTISVGTVSVGDANESDAGAFSITTTGNGSNVSTGAITLNSTNGAADFTIALNGAGSSGSLTLPSITAGGTGVQAGDFSFVSAGTLTGVNVGPISLNAGDNGGQSGVTITSDEATGAVVFGDILNAGNDNVVVNLNSGADVDNTVPSVTLNNVSTSNATFNTTGSINFTFDGISGLLSIAAGGGQAVTIGDANESDSGSFNVTAAGNASGVTVGPVNLNSTNASGDVTIALNGTGSSGAINLSTITAGGAGVQAGDFSLTSAGVFTSLTVGNISLNAGDAAGQSGVTINASDASGAVTFGDILNAGNDSVTVNLNTDATNDVAVPSVTIGNVSNNNAGNNTTGNITFTLDSITGALNIATGLNQGITMGDVNPPANTDSGTFTVQTFNTGTIGTLNLGPVTLGGGNAGGVVISTSSLGAFSAAGQWNFIGGNDITITATTGTLPAITLNDINFVNTSGGITPTINFNAADGIGAVTIASVDYDSNIIGQINFNADTDGAGEATFGTQVGAIGAFLIQNQGDNSWTNAGVPTALAVNDTAYSGTLAALTGSTITIAGGAQNATFTAGNQVALANTGGPGVWGAISFAGASNNVTVNAQDGVPSITATGSNGRMTNFTVNANTDAASEVGGVEAALGALGPVTASGVAGLDSLTGTFAASTFSTFLVSNGNFSSNITTNVSGTTNRNAVTSQVTSVSVPNGNINNGTQANNFTIDDGFVNGITVFQPTPTLGDATLGALDLDADGGLVGATRSGGLPSGISVSGHLTIGSLDTFSGSGTNVVTTTAFNAANNVGPITAGETVTIGTVDVGGNIGSANGTSNDGIILTEAVGAAASNPITITNFRLAGTIDRIANSGNTTGDVITITGGGANGIINGDLDTIDAGVAAFVTTGLRVLTGSTGSPIYTITDLNVDYLLVVDGTFTGGSLDSTVVFPADGGTAGIRVDGVDAASITINDIEGTTSNAASPTGTQLLFLTRATGTSYLATDDNATPWNVTGIQDDIGGGNTGQHDFLQILVEGNARTGAWGADSNNFDGSNAGEPTLGRIKGIEIVGQWDNGPVNIFATSADEISYGSLTTDATPASTPGTVEFSFDNPSGVFGDTVLPPGGNTNGTVEDLNTYTAFAPTSETGVVLSIPNGGFLVKNFIGPTGLFETIRFSDTVGAANDSIPNTVVLDFANGIIDNIYLYGRNIGIEYQAASNATPATSSITDIFYGFDYTPIPAIVATNPSAYAVGTNPRPNEAISFLEFSSTIGNITVRDTDLPATALVNEATDQNPVNTGNIRVGLNVTFQGAPASDLGAITSAALALYINDPNDGTGASGSVVPLNAGVPVYGAIGIIDVDGQLGGVVATGSVASITTTDTVNETLVGGNPVGTATFVGLVTDLTVGSIHTGGTIIGSLVAGDRILLSTGANNAIGGTGINLDVIGINTDGPGAGTTDLFGTSYFTGATSIVVVGGNLGTNAGSVTGSTATPTGAFGPTTITGDQVSAPYGINQTISVTPLSGLTAAFVTGGLGSGNAGTQGQIRSAIVSGKHVLTDLVATTEANDDLAGAYSAVEFFGDVWSGDDISATLTALGITSFLGAGVPVLTGDTLFGGFGSMAIGGTTATANTSFDIFATGAGVVGDAGDITGAIQSDGTSNNITITAGRGNGGSLLANVVFGTDGTGGLTGTNTLSVDTNIGSGNTHVISSADSQTWATVAAGLQNDLNAFGGVLNSDFLAGVPVGASAPLSTNINDATLPIFQNQTDSITITTVNVGFTTDGVDQDGVVTNDMNSAVNGTFAAANNITVTNFNVDGNAIGNDGVAGGHLFAAGLGSRSAASTLTVGGTIVGILSGTLSAGMFVPRDQVGASPLNSNDLGPLQAGTVLTSGTVAIGTFNVGRWEQSAVSTTGADGITLGELLAGTENGANASYAPRFSIGATDAITVTAMTITGRPYVAPQTGPGSGGGTGSGSGLNGTDGDAIDVSIAAFNSVTGTVVVRDSGDFNFVMGGIDAITAANTTAGDPSDASTTLPLNSGATSNTGLNITTYGDGQGDGSAAHGLDVEYYLAGFDYFTRITGGTTLAPNFFSAFGLGSVTGSLIAADSDATNGWGAGNLSFALVAAGENISGNLVAQNDIIARLGSATTDGSALLTGGFDADVLAGANVNSGIAPQAITAQFGGGNISGAIAAGDDILSSDADTLISIAAQGNTDTLGGAHVATGIISGNITSGAANQLAGPAFLSGGTDNETSNINAFIVAGGQISGNIDAGDTQRAQNGTISAPLAAVPVSDLSGGAFRGGIWVGAGADLNINTTSDNAVSGLANSGSFTGALRTVEGVDVTNVGASQMGILVENNIGVSPAVAGSGVIEVGYGASGGALLGNIVAEGNIHEIEVYGNLGSSTAPGLVYAGGVITNFAVGNPLGWPAGGVTATAMNTHPASNYTSTFGTVFSDIYEGGVVTGGSGAINLFIGQSLDANATLLLGVNQGITGTVTIEQAGFRSILTPTAGTAMVIAQTGPNDTGTADAPGYGPDVYLYNNTSLAASATGGNTSLAVTGNGIASGLGRVIAVDNLVTLSVNDGGIRQVIVDDDFDIRSAVIDNGTNTAALERLRVAPSTFPFLTNSLLSVTEIERAVNNQLQGANLTTVTADYNIGSTASGSIGNGLTGLTQSDNVAIWVQGSLLTTGSISSSTGSIGNVYAGGNVTTTNLTSSFSGSYNFTAYQNIGDIYAEVGNIGPTGGSSITVSSATGSVGVISAEDNIGSALTINVRENIGGLIARTGSLSTATIDVHGSIGLLMASGDVGGVLTAETGNIGLDLDADDIFSPLTTDANFARQSTGPVSYGLASDHGNIALTLRAGNSIGNTGALVGSVTAFGANGYIAGNSIGLVSAGTTVSGSFSAERGSIGNILGINGQVSPTLVAGTTIGTITSRLANVNSTSTAGGNIGAITAGTNVAGTYTSTAGSVGNIVAQVGTASPTVTAGVGIGNVTAAGNVTGNYTAETGSIGNFLSQTGNIGSLTATAGGSVGTITATAGLVSSPTVTAVQNIGDITAGGSSAGGTSIAGTFTAQQGSIGNILARTGDLSGTFTAGGAVGSVTASLRDILGSTTVAAGLVPSGAGTSIGDITAGRSILGSTGTGGFYAIRGSIGNVRAFTGNIGTNAVTPTIFTANGNVTIDPDTLQYVAAPANGRKGVGTVFSDLGNIFVNITTGGDVGTDPDTTNSVRGGIAAPLGTVDAEVRIGGNLGGASGQSVDLHPSTSVILGSIGFVRNEDEGASVGLPHTVQGVNANNPLIITTTADDNQLVDYRVIVGSGTAEVIYTVNSDGTVTFNSITYTPGETNASIQVLTTTGGRNATNTFGQSSALTAVNDMVINGSVTSITVEGDLDSLTVNGNVTNITVESLLDDVNISGNLAGGTLSAARLGDVTVTGNIGTSATVRQNIRVGAGHFDSLVSTNGTNFGLQTVVIDTDRNTADGQFFSFPNTLNNDSTTTADDTINAYIGKGAATLTINNGYIQGVSLKGSTASNLVFAAASGALSADALANQAALIKAGVTSKVIRGTDVSNEIGLANSDAHVGSITTLSNKFTLNGLIVDGDLDTLRIPGNVTTLNVQGALNLGVIGGNIKGVDIATDISTGLDATGSASVINVGRDAHRIFTAKGISDLKVVRNAGLIDGGLSITRAVIQGPLGVEILKATNAVKDIQVDGNAGILSSGNAMTNVFVGGSSVSVGARSMNNVQISGSVGVSVAFDSTRTFGTVGLGSAFTSSLGSSTIGSVLGYLILGSRTAAVGELAAIGNTGALNTNLVIVPGTNTSIPVGPPNNTTTYPAETLYYGGLQARLAVNVVVGGHISDTVITQNSSGSDSLFVNVIDDAHVKVGNRIFTKVDGVITSPIPTANLLRP